MLLDFLVFEILLHFICTLNSIKFYCTLAFSVPAMMDSDANKPNPNGKRLLRSSTAAKKDAGALPLSTDTPVPLPGKGSPSRSATGSPVKKKLRKATDGDSVPAVTPNPSTSPNASSSRSTKGRCKLQKKSPKGKGSPSKRKPRKPEHKFSKAYVTRCGPNDPTEIYSYHKCSAGRVSGLPGCLMAACVAYL